jgi:hypothetical protein
VPDKGVIADFSGADERLEINIRYGASLLIAFEIIPSHKSA